MSPRAPGKSALLVIFITILVDIIGLGIIIPVVPHLVMELTGEGVSRAAIYGGWLWFAYAIMQFFCAPILGNLSDRIGRRPVILLSLAALGTDYLIMGFAPTLAWLFVGRALAGVAGASFIPAYAYLADISEPHRRAQNFGLVGAAFGIGFIIGPALGGLLGTLGPRTPFFVAAGLSLLNVTVGFFVLPESLPKESRRPFELRRANPVGALLHVRSYRHVPGLVGAIFFWQLAHQSLPSTWAYYTIHKFRWSEAAVGASLAFVGLMTAISQGLLVRSVVPRFTERRTATLGLACGAVAYLGYAFATRGWMLYVFMLAWLGAALVYPSMNAIASRQAPPNAQGEVQGAVASLYGLASVMGPPMMTQLFGRFSSASGPVYFPGAAFLCAAFLLGVSAALFTRTMRSAVAKPVSPA
jgi:DHA1 family tetracycline resistance protein-like MFS transporter